MASNKNLSKKKRVDPTPPPVITGNNNKKKKSNPTDIALLSMNMGNFDMDSTPSENNSEPAATAATETIDEQEVVKTNKKRKSKPKNNPDQASKEPNTASRKKRKHKISVNEEENNNVPIIVLDAQDNSANTTNTGKTVKEMCEIEFDANGSIMKIIRRSPNANGSVAGSNSASGNNNKRELSMVDLIKLTHNGDLEKLFFKKFLRRAVLKDRPASKKNPQLGVIVAKWLTDTSRRRGKYMEDRESIEKQGKPTTEQGSDSDGNMPNSVESASQTQQQQQQYENNNNNSAVTQEQKKRANQVQSSKGLYDSLPEYIRQKIEADDTEKSTEM